MEFRLDWTQSALQDLKSICDYIAMDNPNAANNVGAEIIERAEVLKNFPDLGPFYPRKTGNRYREVVFSHYRILYKTSKKKKIVQIVRIWHGARGEPKL